jgi:hypothetical protein
MKKIYFKANNEKTAKNLYGLIFPDPTKTAPNQNIFIKNFFFKDF